MNYLFNKHSDEIEKDCSDMLYALMGKAMHSILENDNNKYIQEHRFFFKIANKTISGQFDLYDFMNKTLYDYKFASVWEYIYGLKEDREQQLNIYRFIMRNYSFEVKELKTVFLFRDWSKTKAEFDNGYPQSQMAVIDVPVWDNNKTIKFIEDRIKQMIAPTPCTKEEKWCKGEKWAVMKNGRKTAVKLFENEDLAKKKLSEDKLYYIEHRPGENTRCKHYCDVSNFCKYKNA
jgi:hypothetical protein